MNHKKIVFVLNAITITRCQKRVQEFIDAGYEVEVYGFERGGETYATPAGFTITTIGCHAVSMSYYKRLMVIVKALKELHKKYRGQKDVVFYYFFFDVAFAASLVSKRQYIYEESDIPYANLKPIVFRWFLALWDKRIIRHSLLTTMTSEGFINYHRLQWHRENIIVIPNRVNVSLLQQPYTHKEFEEGKLSIGFVGGFRYRSILNFVNEVVNRFKYVTFHIYGNIMNYEDELKALVKDNSNLILHGIFNNPSDLPYVYENLDLVLATYDADSINAQYAEPNKMYESIFFRVPIIVSKGTFISEKVERLGIGYSVNALDNEDVFRLLESLTKESIHEKIKNLSKIPQIDAVNDNPQLFEYLTERNV